MSKFVLAKIPHLFNWIGLSRKFCFAEPTYSLSVCHQMTLLAFAQNWKNTWPFEYKYPVHNHKIHSLATINQLTSPRRNSLLPSSHQYSGSIQRLFINNPKIENIQRLFCLPNCLSRKSSTSQNYSKTFQPATAINSSNQQQQPAAATSSSSNQQQQPATAINSSNQQQQPAAATSIILPAAPTRPTPASASYHYGS